MKVEKQDTVSDAKTLLAFLLLEWQGVILVPKSALDIKRQAHAGLYTLPGGVVEKEETDLEAACRETWEETGVELDPMKDVIEDLGVFRVEMDDGYVFSIHLFRFKMDAEPSITLSKAHSNYLWMNLNLAQTIEGFVPEVQICLQSIE